MNNAEPRNTSCLVATAFLMAVGCGAISSEDNAVPIRDAGTPQADATNSEVAKLRGMGPEGLKIALSTYDNLPEGAAKKAQGLTVDAVARQRYATSSRLYWHTNLEEAKAAASSSGRPILSLRLLGRLDEDYSCANSRMFRTVLYANQMVSNYMRENFVLHWSSEREVPKVTIDFGQGRIMKSTVAGNSAHYILASDGTPIDVIPGLYSPKAFVEALEPGRAMAARWQSRKPSDKQLQEFRTGRLDAEANAFRTLSEKQRTALAPYRKNSGVTDIVEAELLTVSKMFIELPTVESLAEAPMNPAAVRESVLVGEELDESSRALIVSMGPTDWGLEPKSLQGQALEEMLRELTLRVAGDTLINQHGLHLQIYQLMLESPGLSFDQLNAKIYSDIFVTPADDPWLGLAQPTGFTGLPLDGLSN